jgi:hypothetical protein
MRKLQIAIAIVVLSISFLPAAPYVGISEEVTFAMFFISLFLAFWLVYIVLRYH